MSLPEISAKIEPELHQIQRAIGRRVPSLADYLAFLEEQVTKLDSKKQLVAREICAQTQLVHEVDRVLTVAVQSWEYYTLLSMSV